MATARKTQETNTGQIPENIVNDVDFGTDNINFEDENKQEPINPEELFFQNQENESYTIAVYRLNSNNGRTDSRGGRSYCGQMQFVEFYEDEIKERFGAGEYVIELRKSGKIKGRKTVFIEGETFDDAEPEMRPVEIQQPQPMRPVILQQPTMQTSTSAENFKQFLLMMQQAKELVQNPQNSSLQTPVGSLKDLKENLTEIKDLAEMFNGGTAKGNSVWENIAMTLLAGAVPFAQQAAAKYLQPTAPDAPNAPNPNAPTQNLDGTLTLANGQIVRPVQVRQDYDTPNDAAMSERAEGTLSDSETDNFLDEETEMLIDELVKEMCDPRHQAGLQMDAVQRAANLVKDFKVKNPLASIFISALIQQDAEGVLSQLAALYEKDVADSFYQIGWTLDFIKALKTEIEGGEKK